MNQTARRILAHLKVRKDLILSLSPSGCFVGTDIETGLYHGRVDGCFALVPVEHAEVIPQAKLAVIKSRGLGPYITGARVVSMAEAVAEALLDIDAEMSWVAECGSGRTIYPRDAIDAG